MNQIASLSVLLVFLSVLSFSNSWVFTDINYEKLVKSLIEYDQDYFDNELTEEELKQLKFSLIYPGTKWCGPGNSASSYEDLGSEVATDKCCRAHDNCPDVIPAGETSHNLTNNAFYTRLSCKCDETFRRCLHRANSSVASQIGTIYFNALGTKCYSREYPVTGCKKQGGWLGQKCLQYNYNTKGEKVYQWFDVPNY